MDLDQPVAVPEDSGRRNPTAMAGGLAGIGSVLGAVGASSCCLLPLALFSLGATGPWLGQLTALAPLQPWLLGATAVLLAIGFYLVYRRPRGTCAVDGACIRPARRRLIVAALWFSTVLAAAAAVFPYVAPALLDI